MARRLESSFENYYSVAVKGKGEEEVVCAPAMKACVEYDSTHSYSRHQVELGDLFHALAFFTSAKWSPFCSHRDRPRRLM